MHQTGALTDTSSVSAMSGGMSPYDLLNLPVKRREMQKRKIFFVSDTNHLSLCRFLLQLLFSFLPPPLSLSLSLSLFLSFSSTLTPYDATYMNIL